MTPFRQLHHGPDVLRLPNAWDAGSARLIESAGAPAVATTSAGVAWALGYPDGDALPVDRLVATVRAIARVVSIPLSVDIEAGYGGDVGALITELVGAGAVGINIEDAAAAPAVLAIRIAQARNAATKAGVDLFINARTDVYLRGLVPEPERVTETLARAARYREAGADGLFVPKVIAPTEIRAIAEGCGMPLNVLAWAGLPPISELAALGVRRLSAGSMIAQHACALTAAMTRAFLDDGRAVALPDGAPSYAALNALMPT
jgi:2-methylisocitrate lyase-like PEP mutase family enzyme